MRRSLPLVLTAAVAAACGGTKAAPPPQPVESPVAADGDEAPSDAAPSSGPASAGYSRTLEPEPTACRKNSDCVLSTFAGCCACCPSTPHAFFKPDLARAEKRCETVRCMSCDEACGPDPDLRRYAVRCESGKCIAEPL